MKSRFLISAGMIAAFAALAGAQESPAPAAPEPGGSITTHRQSIETTTTGMAAPAGVSESSATSTSTTSVTGTVRTYEAGKSVTIVRPDGTTVTYLINPESQLPSDVSIGRKVTVTTTTVGGSPQPVVQRLIYTTKTTTTTKSVEPPH